MNAIHQEKAVIDSSKLKAEYDSIVPFAQNLRSETVRQVEKLLETNLIALGFPVQSRVKEFASVLNKCENSMPKFKTIKDIQDIVGVRLILQFKRDVDKVVNVLLQAFSLVRQYDTQKRLGEDRFGYSSIHLILKIPSEWHSLPTLKGTSEILVEVQVRTIAQHMWAETSQTLQYKREDSVPADVKRAIHRVSALLETVDLEFERVLDQKEGYRRSIDDQNRDQETLNVDLLEKVLDGLLPSKNKVLNEPYTELLEELFEFEVRTPEDLNQIIKDEQSNIMEREAEELESRLKASKEGKNVVGTTIERLNQGVFYTHVGLTRAALRKKFGDRYSNRQQELYQLREKNKQSS